MTKKECIHEWNEIGNPDWSNDHYEMFIEIRCNKCGKNDRYVYQYMGVESEL